MKKQVVRNYVPKHAKEHQRATVMKDRKREAKKHGQNAKRRLNSEAPFFWPLNWLEHRFSEGERFIMAVCLKHWPLSFSASSSLFSPHY